MEKLKTGSLDAETSFSIRMYCYGSVGMVMEWALNDNITPAETVVDLMFHSMPAGLHRLFFEEEQQN